jgi:hypothetical protein
MIMMLYGRRWPSLQLTSQAGFGTPHGIDNRVAGPLGQRHLTLMGFQAHRIPP